MACSPSNHWPSVRRTIAPAGNQPTGHVMPSAWLQASRMGVPFQSPVTGLSWRRSIQPTYPSGKRTWTQSPRPSASSVTVSPANTSLTHSDTIRRLRPKRNVAQMGPGLSQCTRDMVRPIPTPRQKRTTSTIANACSTLGQAAVFQGVDQRDHDAGTTRTKRVTQGHRPTVNVDTLRVQAQLLVVGNANHTERFVQFPQVNVLLGGVQLCPTPWATPRRARL